MKHIISILLFITAFSYMALAEETSNYQTSEELEARAQARRERSKYYENLRAEKLEGRQLAVRIYDNWQEDPAEYYLIDVELDGVNIRLDPNQIDPSAFIVVVGEDQEDETVKSYFDFATIARSIKDGCCFKQANSGSFPYKLTFKDGVGKPLQGVNVQLFLYSEELGKDAAIMLREFELKDLNIFKAPYFNGTLERFYLIITHPDNYGTIMVDAEKLGFYTLAPYSGTSAIIKVPWLSSEHEDYANTINGIIIDDSNMPISSARISDELVSTAKNEGKWSKNDGMKFLSDEQGRFSICVPLGRRSSLNVNQSEFDIRIDAPEELGIQPYTGRVLKGSEPIIKMGDYGYFHTFVFEDELGPITNPNVLKTFTLAIRPKKGPVLRYSYDKLKDGGYFPLGRYNASTWKKLGQYEPHYINENSPEELVFKRIEGNTYSGRVVDGITGEPRKGIFVLANRDVLIKIVDPMEMTEDKWDFLENLKANFSQSKEVIEAVNEHFGFDMIAITDSNGRFKLTSPQGTYFNSFMAIEKDYLGCMIFDWYYGEKSDKIINITTIPLFKPTKVTVKPVIPEPNARIRIQYLTDVDNETEEDQENGNQNDINWYGDVNDDFNNIYWPDDVNADFNESRESFSLAAKDYFDIFFTLIHLALNDNYSIFGFPVKIKQYSPYEYYQPDNDIYSYETFQNPFEDPNRIPSFGEINRRSQSYIHNTLLLPNQSQTVFVPADVEHNLQLYVANGKDYELKWAPVTIPKKILLAPGETLDLGNVEFKIAPKVEIEVVDSNDDPVKNVQVQHWRGEYGIFFTKNTDDEGLVDFYARYNEPGEFIVGSKYDDPNLHFAMPYKKITEEENSRFIKIVVPQKILDHIPD